MASLRAWPGVFAAMLALLVLWPATAAADSKRNALVIGVGDYSSDRYPDRVPLASATVCPDVLDNTTVACFRPPDLANALNDARAVRDRLASFGFTVQYEENPDQLAMTEALKRFSRTVDASPRDAVTVIYFAGHSAAIQGELFLVPHGPVSFDPATQTLSETWFLGNSSHANVGQHRYVGLEDLATSLNNRRGAGFNLVILDSCRDNPWTHIQAPIFRSLNPGMFGGVLFTRPGIFNIPTTLESPPTMIMTAVGSGAQAADAGQGGVNSPFTAALLAEFTDPHKPLLDVYMAMGRRMRESRGGQTPMLYGAMAARTACVDGCAPGPPRARAATDPDIIAMLQARAAQAAAIVAMEAAGPNFMRARQSFQEKRRQMRQLDKELELERQGGAWSWTADGFGVATEARDSATPIYGGQMRDGLAHGRGVSRRCIAKGLPSCDQIPARNRPEAQQFILGDHAAGAPSGHAQIRQTAAGTDYFGQIADGKPHGYGVEINANGNRKEGQWRNGRFTRGVFWSHHDQCAVRARTVPPPKGDYRTVDPGSLFSDTLIGDIFSLRYKMPVPAPDDTPPPERCDSALLAAARDPS